VGQEKLREEKLKQAKFMGEFCECEWCGTEYWATCVLSYYLLFVNFSVLL